MKKLNIRNVSMMGVLIALDIVATRFLGFSALTIRISFGSVLIILAGLWFGPVPDRAWHPDRAWEALVP